jgi:hypothetical protein
MIKKLLLTAALLAPGLAYGEEEVVPRPALAAGFTTPVVQADFTVPGNFWSDTSKYITNCNAAASIANQPLTWHFTFIPFGEASNPLPCSRTVITPDPTFGNQALHVVYTPADYSNDNAGTFAFPTPGSGQDTAWLPNEFYVKQVVRSTSSSIQQNNPGPTRMAWALWSSSTNVFYPTPNIDSDFFEIGFQLPGYRFGGQFQDGAKISYYDNCCIYSPATFTLDFTQYHTLEALVTSNETNNIAMCLWMDGTFEGCLSGAAPSGYDYARRDRSIYNNTSTQYGSGSPVNNLEWYIKSFEVWACPNFTTSTCPGTVITSWPQ